MDPAAPTGNANGNGNGNGNGSGIDSGSGSSDGSGIGATVTTEVTTTITTTISRAVIYTVTVCPESVQDCPLRGKLATSFEEVITEYCPGQETAPPNVVTVYQGSPDAAITQASGPAATTVVVVQPAQGGGEPVTVTEQQRPVTTIFEVTSCDSADESCTIGMTTTRTQTIVQTVNVEPVAVESDTGTPAKPSVVPGNQIVYDLGNSTTSACGTACRGNFAAPTGGVQVAAASAVDDGWLDRRYLGLAFGLVWGAMLLL